MSDNPTQPDSMDAGFSQEAIDALLNAADGSEASSEQAPEGVADTTVSQDDIDALMAGGGEVRPDSTGRPFDDEAAAMQTAIEEEQAVAASSPPPPTASDATKPDLPDFDVAVVGVDPKRVTMLNDVKLRVKIELGRTQMLVEEVLKLGEGSVVELDKLAGDPVDVYVNERLVARGEVLVLNDNFCVRISDVVSSDPHRVSA